MSVNHKLVAALSLAAIAWGGYLVLGSGGQGAADSPPAPDPAWMSRHNGRDYYAAHVEAAAEGHPAFSAATATAMLALHAARLLGPEPTRARVDVRTTIATGELFDARLDVELSHDPGSRRTELAVTKLGESDVRLRCAVVDGELESVDVLDADGEPLFEDLAALVRRPTLPIAFGDVQLWDVLGMVAGLREGRLEVLGRAGRPGATGLVVCSLDLLYPPPESEDGRQDTAAADRGPPDGPQQRLQAFGHDALIYVDPQDMHVRTIRVFDREGHLARIYEDFAYAEERSELPIRRFRATSIVTSSHSVIEITTR